MQKQQPASIPGYNLPPPADSKPLASKPKQPQAPIPSQQHHPHFDSKPQPHIELKPIESKQKQEVDQWDGFPAEEQSLANEFQALSLKDDEPLKNDETQNDKIVAASCEVADKQPVNDLQSNAKDGKAENDTAEQNESQTKPKKKHRGGRKKGKKQETSKEDVPPVAELKFELAAQCKPKALVEDVKFELPTNFQTKQSCNRDNKSNQSSQIESKNTKSSKSKNTKRKFSLLSNIEFALIA